MASSCSQRHKVLLLMLATTALALDAVRQVGHAERGQRHTQIDGQFAGQRLDLNGELWGEKPGGDPGGPVLPSPPIAH